MPRFYALKLEPDSGTVFWSFCPRTIPGGEGSCSLRVRQAKEGTPPQSGQEGGRPGCQCCHPGCGRYF